MSVNAGAREFKRPRRTLQDHLNKNLFNTLGRKSTLSSYPENKSFQSIMKLTSVGYPLLSKAIRSSIFTFCDANNIKPSFNKEKNLLGQTGLNYFLYVIHRLRNAKNSFKSRRNS